MIIGTEFVDLPPISADPAAELKEWLREAEGDRPWAGIATDAARIIAQSDTPPDWLEPPLARAAHYLGGSVSPNSSRGPSLISSLDNYPTRVELREQLDNALLLAKQMQDALRNQNLSPVLAAPMPDGIERLRRFTSDLDQWLVPALSRARDGIRQGKGRDKHFLFDLRLSPHEVCAVWIAAAWEETNGCPVPHASRHAHDACERLWHAAGQRPARWGETRRGWLDHLRAAKNADHACWVQAFRNVFHRRREVLRRIAGLQEIIDPRLNRPKDP